MTQQCIRGSVKKGEIPGRGGGILGQMVVMLAAGEALAGGFHIAVHDAAAIARGNAVVASVSGASAVYYNPAALAGVKQREAQLGLYSISLDTDVDLGGVSAGTDHSWQFVPHFFYAQPLGEDWAFGLGLHVPFGLETDWSGTVLEPFATKNRVEDRVVSLVAGRQVTDTLALGGGVMFHDMELELGRAPGGVRTRFQGDDESWSWVLAAQWTPAPNHAFGLTYRTGTDFALRGRLQQGTMSVPAQMRFDVPDTAALGYQYRINEAWSIEGNVEWIRWSQLGSYTIESGGIALQPVPFEWKDSWMFELGVTREFGNGWRASAGYVFNENSQPAGPTFTPAVADADRHWLSCGAGRSWGDFSFFLAYQYGFSSRQVSGTVQGGADGRYRTSAHTLSLQTNFSF